MIQNSVWAVVPKTGPSLDGPTNPPGEYQSLDRALNAVVLNLWIVTRSGLNNPFTRGSPKATRKHIIFILQFITVTKLQLGRK